MVEAETGQRAGRKEWLALAVLALPTLLVSLDTFVMLLALPHLAEGLGAGSTEQLWIMDVYGFMVAGFMVTMGTLGDRIGRRKLLLIGAAAFGLCSILAAYSTSPLMLILARAALGIAGATLAPSTLSLIMVMFHDRRQRATAVGIWAGVFTVGAIIGPLVGGAMLDHFWWGSVFLLGVPAMVLLLAVGRVLLPEYRDVTAGRLDLTSVVFSLAAILSIIYGLKEIARLGWRPVPIVVLVVGLVMGWVFLRRQRRLDDPLVDLGLFRLRGFSVTLTGMAVYSMLSGGTMVFVAQYFQLVAGLSPLQAGLALVPGMVAAIIGFQVAPLLARRIRPAFLFAGGLAVCVSGMLILTQASAADGLTTVIVGFAVTSIGAGPLVSLGTNIVISAAPPEKAGSASGIAQTGNEFGYAFGIAALGSIGAAAYRANLPGDTIAAARDSIISALAAAQELPGKAGADLVALAQQAFTSSLHTVALVSGILLAALALLVLVRLRHLPSISATQDEEQPEPGQLADGHPGYQRPSTNPRTAPSCASHLFLEGPQPHGRHDGAEAVGVARPDDVAVPLPIEQLPGAQPPGSDTAVVDSNHHRSRHLQPTERTWQQHLGGSFEQKYGTIVSWAPRRAGCRPGGYRQASSRPGGDPPLRRAPVPSAEPRSLE